MATWPIVMMRGEWGYQGEDFMEEKHLMKREKRGYNNVVHHIKQKQQKRRIMRFSHTNAALSCVWARMG